MDHPSPNPEWWYSSTASWWAACMAKEGGGRFAPSSRKGSPHLEPVQGCLRRALRPHHREDPLAAPAGPALAAAERAPLSYPGRTMGIPACECPSLESEFVELSKINCYKSCTLGLTLPYIKKTIKYKTDGPLPADI